MVWHGLSSYFMANKSHLIHLKGVDIAYTWDISLSMADKKWWMTTMGGQSKNTDIFIGIQRDNDDHQEHEIWDIWDISHDGSMVLLYMLT